MPQSAVTPYGKMLCAYFYTGLSRMSNIIKQLDGAIPLPYARLSPGFAHTDIPEGPHEANDYQGTEDKTDHIQTRS